MVKNKDGELEFDLLQFSKELWRNALVIILVALILGGAAFAWTFLTSTPVYAATAKLYVNNAVSVGGTKLAVSSNDLYVSQSLVTTYAEILKSRTTLSEIAEEAGVSYSPDSLAYMISVVPVEGTGIFGVTVRSTSPTEAELIANTVAKVLPDRISDIVEGCSVRVVDYAIVPSHRSSSGYFRNITTGALVGALLVVAVIFLKSYLNAKSDIIIGSSDDLTEMYPDIPVLAVIPDMRASSKKGYYSAYSSYYGEKREAK